MCLTLRGNYGDGDSDDHNKGGGRLIHGFLKGKYVSSFLLFTLIDLKFEKGS